MRPRGRGNIPHSERDKVYTKTLTELSAEFNMPRNILRRAVEEKKLTFIKVKGVCFLCPDEVERVFHKKALRLKEFEFENKDKLLGKIMKVLSDFNEWYDMPEKEYVLMYDALQKVIKDFLSDLSREIKREQNPDRVLREKRPPRRPT